MYRFQKFIFAVCLIFLGAASSCSNDQRRDIRNYYFPLKTLTDGMVYEYQAIQPDSLTPQYWYYRSLIQDDQVLLTATLYEADFIPRQLVKEELVSNGMLLNDLYLYYTDSLDRQESYDINIIAGNTFPFKVSQPSGIFLYNINWTDPNDGSTTTLIKNRRYLGDTTFNYAGVNYNDCVAFEVRELVEVDSEGVLSQEFSGVEFYAKNVGLIYYKKEIPNLFTLEYALADRYPMDSLEVMFGEYLKNED